MRIAAKFERGCDCLLWITWAKLPHVMDVASNCFFVTLRVPFEVKLYDVILYEVLEADRELPDHVQRRVLAFPALLEVRLDQIVWRSLLPWGEPDIEWIILGRFRLRADCWVEKEGRNSLGERRSEDRADIATVRVAMQVKFFWHIPVEWHLIEPGREPTDVVIVDSSRRTQDLFLNLYSTAGAKTQHINCNDPEVSH